MERSLSLRLLGRHCEVKKGQLTFLLAKRRGNPESHRRGKNWIASSQGLLAMTEAAFDEVAAG
jgi:hypothetical protein